MANGGIIGPNNPVGKIGTVSKVSVFTESGTLTTGACTSQVAAVIVAGGAGGGGDEQGGGGGAGGVNLLSGSPVCASSPYAVTIGAGGAGVSTPAKGTSGVNSSLVTGAGTQTATGGGGGGAGVPGGGGQAGN